MVCRFPFLHISFQLVRSSAEVQVKYFPGSSFKGYTTVDKAIAAWELAVANNVVGLPRSKHLSTTHMVPPTTPSRQAAKLTSLVQPSTPSRVPRTALTALNSPIHTAATPRSPEHHTTSSMPSARGSETRLAAIITALNDIELTSYYVVIRGEKPGVYSSRLVSLLSPFYSF